MVTVDLARPLMREYYDTLLATGDECANRFGAAIVRDGEDVDVTGYAVSGTFIRPDGVTIPIDGAKDGNTVFVDLPAPCYKEDGKFTLYIKIIKEGEMVTVRMVDGYIRRTDTGNYVSEEETIISLDQMKGLANEVAVINTEAKNLLVELEGVVDEARKLAEDVPEYVEQVVTDKIPSIVDEVLASLPTAEGVSF